MFNPTGIESLILLLVNWAKSLLPFKQHSKNEILRTEEKKKWYVPGIYLGHFTNFSFRVRYGNRNMQFISPVIKLWLGGLPKKWKAAFACMLIWTSFEKSQKNHSHLVLFSYSSCLWQCKTLTRTTCGKHNVTAYQTVAILHTQEKDIWYHGFYKDTKLQE